MNSLKPGFLKYKQIDKGILFLLCIAFFNLLIHLLTNGQYGFHRDELYIIDCGKHPDLGYADMPPFTPLAAKITIEILGESLRSLRLLPSIITSIIIFLTGLMTRELGGKFFAQSLASIGVLTAPVYMISGTQFQTTVFDQFFWVLICFVIVRILLSGNQKLWLIAGLLAGISLLNKYTMSVFIGSVVLGIFLSSQKSFLMNKWFWMGMIIAMLIFIPNIIWQLRHQWPVMEHMRALGEDESIPRIRFIFEQAIVMGPLAIPIWICGILFFFFNSKGKQYAILAWGFIIPFLFFLLLKGKSYYLSNAYPILLIGGSILVESILIKRQLKWLGWIYLSLMLVLALIFSPLWLPVFSVDKMIKYDIADIRYDFREMTGWDELVRNVAAVYNHLPVTERSQVVIITGNYGEAGAINHFGPLYGLPKAGSGIGSYYYWGWGNPEAKVFLFVGYPEEFLKKLFFETNLAAVNRNPYGIKNEEDGIEIVVCKYPVKPFAEIWPEFKHF